MEKSNYSIEEINKILLQRKTKLIIDSAESPSTDNKVIVLSISKNIEDLGFIFSRDLFELLVHKSEAYLIDFYQWLVLELTEMVGSHVEHKPFYKNFPQQMGSLSDLDLLMNALVHYWTNGLWQPEYVEISRLTLEDSKPQTRTIKLGHISEFHQIFTNMMLSNSSLSMSDQDLLGWYIKNTKTDDLVGLLPKSIPSKEILSYVAAQIMENHPSRSDIMSSYFKTATDVLRFATSFSWGDNSLAENTWFRSFTRAERRFILSLLDQCRNLEEEMGRYPEKWKRLGERLHPGDYSKKYPNAYHVFTKIRNVEKLYSFNSEVERSIKIKDLDLTLSLLSRRPGELARKLDFLARTFPNQVHEITSCFYKVVGKISSRVLIQLIAHFKNRNSDNSTRSFFPKGNIAKVQVIENTLPALPGTFCSEIVNISEKELITRFEEKEPLGKVYVDPILQDIMVPITQRSSSRTLKTYARGSKFDLGENCNTIRAFIHWSNVLVPETNVMRLDIYKDSHDSILGSEIVEENREMAPIQDWRSVLQGTANNQGQANNEQKPEVETFRQIRTDIDLSLGLYNENWDYIEHISYTNLRSEKFDGLYHSGDIVDAPEGASEFIDMDILTLRERQVRYAVFNVYSYTEQGFNEIPECFFGWMEREDINTGEIFEPKTVVNKIYLASPTTICLPVVFDLKLRKAIWLDVSLRSDPNWVNNLEANRNNVVLISKALIEMNKPNLYDLFMLNVQARGELVDDPKNADKIFGISEEDDVTPFQVEMILAEFL